MTIDDIDMQLIAILRNDARRSVSDLAHDLGVSRATVRARMDRLVKSGAILGFTVTLKDDLSEVPVRAVMMLRVDAKRTKALLRTLMGYAQVRAVYSTNGRWDLMVDLACKDLAEFDEIIENIRLIQGVTGSESNLLLTAYKHST